MSVQSLHAMRGYPLSSISIFYHNKNLTIHRNNADDLFLRLLDEDNCDIGNKLIQQNLARSIETNTPLTDDDGDEEDAENRLPG